MYQVFKIEHRNSTTNRSNITGSKKKTHASSLWSLWTGRTFETSTRSLWHLGPLRKKVKVNHIQIIFRMVCFWFIWNRRNDAVHNKPVRPFSSISSMAKQELCRAVNIKLYNTQANNIKNNQQLNKQWFFNQLFVQTNLFVSFNPDL
jgi:hypothetical protein